MCILIRVRMRDHVFPVARGSEAPVIAGCHAPSRSPTSSPLGSRAPQLLLNFHPCPLKSALSAYIHEKLLT